jgi:ribose 1,5-bisphosphate isomerase
MENLQEQIDQICNDREHGSRWLVKAAVTLLRDLAKEPGASEEEQLCLLFRSAYHIAQARPAMAALASAMGNVMSVYEDGIQAIAGQAQTLLDEYETATTRIAEHAQTYLRGRLLTCSVSGTIVDAFVVNRERIEHVTLLEGRPRYEGREMARLLRQQGIAVTVITDAQADIFLPLCDAVVVGADSVLVNGDVLNKAGTALLAWAAHGRNIPLYVLCETLKISPHRWHEHDGTRIKENLALLEEKEPEEVWEQAPADIEVRNFYFDRTPYRLLQSVITEQGIMDRRAIREIAVKTRANERLLAKMQRKG